MTDKDLLDNLFNYVASQDRLFSLAGDRVSGFSLKLLYHNGPLCSKSSFVYLFMLCINFEIDRCLSSLGHSAPE